MAVNVSVFDLENFPNNPKTITVDLTELVPFGNSGEDTWVFSAITTATASGSAVIQRLYISTTKFGWIKSSGLNSGPYTITASQKHIKVSIDEDISNGVEIALDTSGLDIGGDAVALDLQAKISALASAGGGKTGNLAYLNVIVRHVNGVFEIISGSTSSVYTGTLRSSVAIVDGTSTTGLAAELGFDMSYASETLASIPPTQTSLASDYTSGTSITISTANGVLAGDCIAITDGTNTEFRGVENGIGINVTLSSGLANTYASGSRIQVLKSQDPSGQPSPAHTNLDDIIKFAIASIVNQIDFSA